MKYYKSSATIPAFNFFEAISKKDVRWLIKGYNEDSEDIKLSKKEASRLEKTLEKIYFEYVDYTNDTKTKFIYKKQILVKQWEITHTIVEECLALYIRTQDTEVLEIINKMNDNGFNVNFEKSIISEVNRLQRKLKLLRNRIKIYKINITNSLKGVETKEAFDIDKAALAIEQNLEMKRELDPRKETLKRFIFLIEMNKAKIAKYESDKHNNRKSKTKSARPR